MTEDAEWMDFNHPPELLLEQRSRGGEIVTKIEKHQKQRPEHLEWIDPNRPPKLVVE
jgi:hypothetical protein